MNHQSKQYHMIRFKVSQTKITLKGNLMRRKKIVLRKNTVKFLNFFIKNTSLYWTKTSYFPRYLCVVLNFVFSAVQRILIFVFML